MYLVPNNEVNQLRRHTHAYLKSIEFLQYIKFQELDVLKGELDHTVKMRLLLQLLKILS